MVRQKSQFIIISVLNKDKLATYQIHLLSQKSKLPTYKAFIILEKYSLQHRNFVDVPGATTSLHVQLQMGVIREYSQNIIHLLYVIFLLYIINNIFCSPRQ